MPQNDLLQTLTTTALTTALAVTISLPLLQMDAVSRKVLSPDRLRAKRRKTQIYEMDKAVEIQRLRARAVVQAEALSAKEDNKSDGTTWRYNPKEDRIATALLTTQEEYDAVVKSIMDKNKSSPFIVAIDKDEDDGLDKKEIYLWLAFPPTTKDNKEALNSSDGEKDGSSSSSSESEWRRIQIPLVPFATTLAAAFEDQMTSTALCFITDASSTLSATVLHHVLEESGAGLALVKEPSWMVVVARILQRNLIQRDNVAKTLFALTRLEAWRVRDQVGSSRTVVFTLPGQATTPTLLPLLYQSFPHERHVFAYDTCFESVSRGMMLRKTSVKLSGLMLPSIGGIGGENEASTAVENALKMPEWVTATSPITQLKSIRKLGDALADLPADQAGIVEAWMASIDAFLQLKAEEKTNNYTPFVCRLGFLMGRTGLGNLNSDKVEELNELSLINLLQYVTGSRSRPLKPEVVSAARKSLVDIKAKCVADVEGYQFTHEEKKLLEACCFLHHGILIGDKTLMDTVQPQKEWSLKAARKLQSCACCDPEEEEEDGDMDDSGATASNKEGGKIDMTMPGAFAMGLNKRPNAAGSSDSPAAKKKTGYVDGKTTFAFDPTKF